VLETASVLEAASVLEVVTADKVEEELPLLELASDDDSGDDEDEKGAVGVTALLAVLLVLSGTAAELLLPVLEGDSRIDEASVIDGRITVPDPVPKEEVPFDHVDAELTVSEETGAASVELPDTFAEGLATTEE
jgi:hypothetical protein